VDTRFVVAVLLSVLSTSALAQASSSSPALASPYAAPAGGAGFTSSQNPYAPGGIYDPYRTTTPGRSGSAHQGVGGAQNGIGLGGKGALGGRSAALGAGSMPGDSGSISSLRGSSALGAAAGSRCGGGISSSMGGYKAGLSSSIGSHGAGSGGLAASSRCGSAAALGHGSRLPDLGGRNIGTAGATGAGGLGGGSSMDSLRSRLQQGPR
jgi:hypothetical protein